MTNLAKSLTAAAALGALAAAPLAAQYPYPQPYPPQAYPPGYYPQQQYGYGGSAIDQIVNQLLGNRYNVTDRQAVSRCASAAMARARDQYRGYGYQQGYGDQQDYDDHRGYGYQQGIAAPAMRVTAITSVERRSGGLRVRGLLDTGMYGGQRYIGNRPYGYQNQGYGAGDLTFRCDVDYRGYVSNVRVNRNDQYRRY